MHGNHTLRISKYYKLLNIKIVKTNFVQKIKECRILYSEYRKIGIGQQEGDIVKKEARFQLLINLINVKFIRSHKFSDYNFILTVFNIMTVFFVHKSPEYFTILRRKCILIAFAIY